MKEIHRIIVPVDFLGHTDQLVEYAAYFAKKFDATLIFVHIIENLNMYGDYVYPSAEQFEKEMMDHAKEKMIKLVEMNKSACPGCEGKVDRGDVVAAIIHFAKEQNSDLIVIGTHGRKGLEKMWLGSVAERVVKRAPCPTLTFNPYKDTA